MVIWVANTARPHPCRKVREKDGGTLNSLSAISCISLPNQGSVWISTDSTAGKLLTMGFQLSPASAEA